MMNDSVAARLFTVTTTVLSVMVTSSAGGVTTTLSICSSGLITSVTWTFSHVTPASGLGFATVMVNRT